MAAARTSAALMLLSAITFAPIGFAAGDYAGTATATVLTKTTKSWDGKAIEYPKGEAEVSIARVDIPPGGDTDWHLHPVPSFGVVLKGTLEVHLEDGRVKRVGPGEPLIEVVNTRHHGHNAGTEPVELIVFYAGVAGTPNIVKSPKSE
jgi:quercetin dioxygenase-like cupin family protein